jgi:hypothetical protein
MRARRRPETKRINFFSCFLSGFEEGVEEKLEKHKSLMIPAFRPIFGRYNINFWYVEKKYEKRRKVCHNNWTIEIQYVNPLEFDFFSFHSFETKSCAKKMIPTDVLGAMQFNELVQLECKSLCSY